MTIALEIRAEERESRDAQLQKETNACHPSIAMTHRENQTLVFPPSANTKDKPSRLSFIY